jgi:hypothetical protein
MNKLIRFLLPMIIALQIPTLSCFAAGFTKEAIDFEARSLMNRMEITRDVSFNLKNRLSTALNDSTLSEVIKSRGVGGVFVYAAGEGAVLVRYMGGDGLISFAEGRKAAPIRLECWGIGAMIGGSAQWGIGLMIGRPDEKTFSGHYRGGLRTATAWEAATRALLYLSRPNGENYDEIYVVTMGRGLSAGVGGVSMNIIAAW